MNLVKWLRKNNVKIMAVVIIVLMIGFIGGSSLQQLFLRRQTGLHKPVAYYGQNKKITNYDLYLAQQELEILEMLGTDIILRSANLPLFRAKDLGALLPGQLLFTERTISPALIMALKQMIRTSGYRISDKQINDIYRTSAPKNLYWLLLQKEAEQAGIRISNSIARDQFARIVPQIYPGKTYAQLVGPIVNRRGIPEKNIITAFGKLMAVLEYARMICASENVTGSQVMHNASMEVETIDVELVKFDSAVFADTQDEPNEQKILEHFEKYKGFLPGAISDENPYGFGYKLADRAQLEYIALKLNDISKIVTQPTQEQIEQYYQKNRKQFTEQFPSDPNDPNSPLTERIKSYAEVAAAISETLLQNEIDSKAENILYEAKTLTEPALEDTEPSNITVEQLKQTAGDYKVAAYQLTEKYKINVYAGKTGLLSATDILADEHLGRMFLPSQEFNPVWLPRIVFAIDELAVSELGPFDVPKPRLYENIGPLKDISALGLLPEQIMALVRVIDAKKAAESETINLTFSKKGLKFDQDEKPTDQDIYSVKEKVIEDLKKLAAMDTAKSKAEEFVKQIVKDGWDGAIEKFNQLYPQKQKQNELDPNTFELQNLTGLKRMSKDILETLAVQNQGDPTAEFSNNLRKKQSRFIDQLYSLVPQDSNSLDTVPFIMEFKPDMSYYCLKNLSVNRLYQQEYEQIKALQFYKQDIAQSQALAVVYFNPENILKRMNFRWVKQDKEPADANAPAKSEGAS